MLTGPLAENLVRSGEPAEFAARVRSLRDWRVAKPELGSLGREHVERNFSLRKLGDRITQTIETAAGDGRHG
jgi:hypothetical protein